MNVAAEWALSWHQIAEYQEGFRSPGSWTYSEDTWLAVPIFKINNLILELHSFSTQSYQKTKKGEIYTVLLGQNIIFGHQK